MSTTQTRCPSWCTDHLDLGDDEQICQSEERMVGDQSIVVVGPDECGGAPGGVFFFETRRGMPPTPLTVTDARAALASIRNGISARTALADALELAVDQAAEVNR